MHHERNLLVAQEFVRNKGIGKVTLEGSRCCDTHKNYIGKNIFPFVLYALNNEVQILNRLRILNIRKPLVLTQLNSLNQTVDCFIFVINIKNSFFFFF